MGNKSLLEDLCFYFIYCKNMLLWLVTVIVKIKGFIVRDLFIKVSNFFFIKYSTRKQSRGTCAP